MPTKIINLFEEVTNDLRDLKIEKDKYQVIIKNLIKMIHCVNFNVYRNNIDMGFSNKVEVIEQYRQSVINSENFGFFLCNRKNSEIKYNDNVCSV